MKPRREVCESMQLDSDDTFHEKVSDIEGTVMNLSPQSLANLDTSVLHANCECTGGTKTNFSCVMYASEREG
jgi:hypothetical protein